MSISIQVDKIFTVLSSVSMAVSEEMWSEPHHHDLNTLIVNILRSPCDATASACLQKDRETLVLGIEAVDVCGAALALLFRLVRATPRHKLKRSRKLWQIRNKICDLLL